MSNQFSRLSFHGLDSVARAIESVADGTKPQLAKIHSDLYVSRSVHDFANEMVARIETGTLSQEDAFAICNGITEELPRTLRSIELKTLPCSPKFDEQEEAESA